MIRRVVLVLLGVGLPLALAAALGWLLASRSGLVFLLDRLAAAQPELGLEVGRIEGHAGSARLTDLRLRWAQRPVHVARLELDWAPAALLGGKLRLRRLAAAGVEIGAPDEDAAGGADPGFDPDRFAWGNPLEGWPLDLEVERLELAAATLAGAPVADRVLLAGRLERGQGLRLERLHWQRGEDRLDLAGSLFAEEPGGVAGTWAWAGRSGEIRLRAGREGARVLLGRSAARPAVDFELMAPRRWRLAVEASPAELEALAVPMPEGSELRLALHGEGGRAELGGRLRLGALELAELGGRLDWLAQDQALRITGMVGHAPGGGGFRLDGVVLGSTPLHADLDLAFDGWPLATAAQGEAAGVLGGRLQVQGPLDRLGLALAAELERAGQRMPLYLDGIWSGERLEIERLEAGIAGAQLRASGWFRLAPERSLSLAVRAEGFDPAWWWPGFDGQLDLDAELALAGLGEPGWSGELDLHRLQGSWLGAPVSGQGRLVLREGRPQGQLDLGLAGGRLQVRTVAEDAVRAELDALPLAAFGRGWQGRIDGHVELAPPWQLGSVQADLRASGLQVEGARAARLGVRGALARGRGLTIEVEGLAGPAGLPALSGSAQLSGEPGRHLGHLALQGEAFSIVADWRRPDPAALEFETLALEAPGLGRWDLDGPARVGLDAGFEPACLHSGTARLCLGVDRDAGGAALHADLQGLPLERLEVLDGMEGLELEGRVAGTLRWRLEPQPALESARLVVEEGRLVDVDADAPRVVLGWQAIEAQLEAVDGLWRVRADGRLEPDGRILLDLAVPSDAPLDRARWQGRLDLDIDRLEALALLAPDLTATRGSLHGRFEWQPGLPSRGELALSGLSARVPALGIALRDAWLRLHQDGPELRLEGHIESGGGPLELEGRLLPGAQPDLRLRLTGAAVRVASTRHLRLVASPDLELGWRPGELRLSGSVSIPEAVIDLERLEAGVRPSPDVIVLDPRQPSRGVAALRWDTRLRVVLGEGVRLEGFGFAGGLRGAVDLRERPGQPLKARGTLELSGTYKAWGQELQIEEGRLLYAQAPLGNPAIDLRARRPLREVEVGVEVRGPARQPRLSVWSQPPMDQAEALSWLVLGRPLSTASAVDGARLGQAAAAAGGNLLAARVGSRLGLDTFGVADSAALGGAAFTVGKYLSPRLYLAYGVGLFEEGSVITLRYLLRRGLELEFEAARESRIGIGYRGEHD